ncbi:hypothetical protein Q3G72_005078 [Acer saccharum]|nr:hypothetical protein Q3G72_005078 [Acer saccharum]
MNINLFFNLLNGIEKCHTRDGFVLFKAICNLYTSVSSNAGVSSNNYSSSSDVDRGDVACMAILVPAGHAQILGLLLVPELQKWCAALTSTPSCLM